MALIISEKQMLRWFEVKDAMRDLTVLAKTFLTRNDLAQIEQIGVVDEVIEYYLYQSLISCLLYSYNRHICEEEKQLYYISQNYGAIVELANYLVKQGASSRAYSETNDIDLNTIQSISSDGRTITFRSASEIESSSNTIIPIPASIQCKLPKQRVKVW